jgi:16S rRNA (guanine966-N2)-methyltransferase
MTGFIAIIFVGRVSVGSEGFGWIELGLCNRMYAPFTKGEFYAIFSFAVSINNDITRLNRKNRPVETTALRIIGGLMRSRKIQFAVDPRTRPMKDRTREAVMNLLGGTLEPAIAFDLFGGTGVLAFESLSRGADSAVIFEILKPAAREILANAKSLGVADRIRVISSDVVAWSERLIENLGSLVEIDAKSESGNEGSKTTWLVFCCPPYSMWESDGERLRQMLSTWIENAPIGSLFVVELHDTTPGELLPDCNQWDIRLYRPAKIAISEKIATTPTL